MKFFCNELSLFACSLIGSDRESYSSANSHFGQLVVVLLGRRKFALGFGHSSQALVYGPVPNPRASSSLHSQ